MSLLLAPLVDLYSTALEPIAPFTWFGLQISTLDIAATFRLCLVLRQLRESLHAQHVSSRGKGAAVEPKSFAKDVSTTLTVVYGGEAVTAPLLGRTPSFMLSGVGPGLYAGVQALVELLPVVPSLSPQLELPLSILDGFSRAILLCDIIPPVVTTSASSAVATSPWTLLLSSLMIANGGFFFTNLFSFLHPTPLTLTTPPELRPYGWATTDLWCAPLITGLYALLTHAQPFWADLHAVVVGLIGGGGETELKSVEAVDASVARTVCAVILATLFATRTVKNLALQSNKAAKKVAQKSGKVKTQ